MRILGEEVEAALYARETARGWKRSGLIAPEQLSAIEGALGPMPGEAGWAVRALFFWLAWMAAGSVASFLSWTVFGETTTAAIFMGVSAAGSYYIGQRVLKANKLYRFGVEEGLLVAALFHLCGALLLAAGRGLDFEQYALLLGIPAALYCAWLYARFGYLYGAFGAVLALTLVACSQFKGFKENDARVVLAVLYAILLAATALRKEISAHDRLGWQVLQSFLFLMICLFLNLRLEKLADFDRVSAPEASAFYWASFGAICVGPAAALVWAVRSRQRPLLIAAFTACLLALVSVKPYLGLERHAWDPAVLGAFLMTLSLWLKHRLDSGPDGQRDGWTAKSLIVGRNDGPDLSSLIAAATAASAGGGTPAPQDKGFTGQGGSSGGAGASGSL